MRQFTKRKNSKSSMVYQDSFIDADFEEDDYTEQKVYRPKSPEIDEEVLAGFDMRSQQIVGLIGNKNDKIDLSAESKPVCQVIQPIYGVSYTENLLDGGSTNIRLEGESFYQTPGRTMRKDELEQKQILERESKVKDYRTSRDGNLTAS